MVRRASWQAWTESSRFKWTEDPIFRLNGRGAFYHIGGEDSMYMKAHKDGLLEIGTYEGAIPHIGEAFFTVDARRQCADFNEAFETMLRAGGKRFLVDMFSGDTPVIPKIEPPSVMEQIKGARQAPRQPGKDAPQKHKSKGGPEL